MSQLLGMFSGQEVVQEKLQNTSNLGLEEYLKYRQELDKARAEIKGEYERARTRSYRLKTDLMDKYDKLYKHVLDGQAKEEEFRKMQDEKDRRGGTVRKLFGHRAHQLATEEMEKEREDFTEFEEQLLEACDKLVSEYDEAETEVERQNNNLGNFLNDQGKIIASVEQAEAMDTKLRRRQMRQEAHKHILDALNRFNTDPEMGCAAADRIRASLREQGDKNATGAIDKVAEEFKHLENLEEQTDNLVDRRLGFEL